MIAQYFTPQEAAEKLKLSENTIRAWCKEQKLVGATCLQGRWRIPEEALQRVIEEGVPQRVSSGMLRPKRTRRASVEGAWA